MKKIIIGNKKRVITPEGNLFLNLEEGKEGCIEIQIPKKADIRVIALVHARNDDKYKLSYKITHKFPFTYSNSIFKAVLEGQSSFDFEGLIDIENGANNSNAYLKVNVLMLSSEAKANIVPSLEIKENEIQASHGATITRIDKNQVFYMQARGISEKKAKKLIIEGFLKAD